MTALTARLLLICFALPLPFFAASAAEPSAFDRYGGLRSVRREATGFFRVELIGARWFFITPEGHPFVALGANHVGAFLKNQAEPSGFLARHGGDPARAAAALLAELRALGLNAGDAYQPEPSHAEAWPWIHPIVNYGPERVRGLALDVFDAEAMAEVQAHVRRRAAEVAANPFVLGIAGVDLPQWGPPRVERYRATAPGSPGRARYEALLRERHGGDIARLNAAYGTRFASFAALAAEPTLTLKSTTPAARADDEAFLELVADTFFAALRAACKAGAPRHLFLGERTQLRAIPDGVLRAMGRHVDVFCTQALIRSAQRPPEWQDFQRDAYDREAALTGKPMIVVDWAAPFSLGATFDHEHGVIRAERDAAADSARFVRDCLAAPYMIGLFICQPIGTHPNDRWFDGRARRTYLAPAGPPFVHRAAQLRAANEAALARVYAEAAAR